jgi:hypothetical protein
MLLADYVFITDRETKMEKSNPTVAIIIFIILFGFAVHLFREAIFVIMFAAVLFWLSYYGGLALWARSLNSYCGLTVIKAKN